MEVDIKRYNIPNNEREKAIMVRDVVNKKLLVLEVNMCLLIHSQNHLFLHLFFLSLSIKALVVPGQEELMKQTSTYHKYTS